MRRFRRIVTVGVDRAVDRMIRRDPSAYALNAAVATAKRDVSDGEALAELHAQLAHIAPEALTQASFACQARSDYIDDRAYRLLTAVRDGGPVMPVPTERRSLFEQEARLGRQPLARAFEELARAEPRLKEVVAGYGNRDRMERVRACEQLVGPASGNRDALLAGAIALKIAVRYTLQRGDGPDSDSRALFDYPDVRFHQRTTTPVV